MNFDPCEFKGCSSLAWANVTVVINHEDDQTDGPAALLCETHYELVSHMLEEVFEFVEGQLMPGADELSDDADEGWQPWA